MNKVITIDGPSASGKGTLATLLAERLNWKILDSGALYRAFAYFSINENDEKLIEENLKINEYVNIKSFGDHRIAMSFLVAGLRSDAKIYVDDCKNIETSFPSFFETFSSLGADIKIT